MLKKPLLLIALLFCFKSLAHKDTSYSKTYDKTTVIFTTGYVYEEINKGYIIGEYASMLAKELGCKDSLWIFLRHNYTRSDRYPNNLNFKKSKGHFFIKYYKSDYSILEALNLVEYSILNRKKTDSLSDDALKKIETQKPSELVKKIMAKRIYRPNEVDDLISDSPFSYYTEGNKYYIYRKTMYDESILVLDNIYLFDPLRSSSAIIFDSHESFYYLASHEENPQKAFLPESERFYRPFILNRLSHNIIAFTHIRDESLLLYFIDKNKLELIEE